MGIKNFKPVLTSEINFKLETTLKFRMKQEVLSCTHEGDEYSLCSTGGLGGCSLILSVNGKNYIADLRPLIESLITQIAE